MADVRWFDSVVGAWKFWDRTVRAKPFEVSVQLVRPANTDVYAAGDLVNSGPARNCAFANASKTLTPTGGTAGIFAGMAVTGASIAANTVVVSVADTAVTVDKNTTAEQAAEVVTFTNTASLPMLDFSVQGGTAGQFIEVRSAIITSNNGNAATKLNAQIAFFKSGDMQANCADSTAFAPAYATVITNKSGRLDDVSTLLSQGATCYEVMQADVSRIMALGTGGKLYPAIIVSNSASAASGEIITLTVKGIFH